ncbi:MAG: hypothetical protein ACE5JL_08805, partial [Dehalococcoidia bacterium]
MVGIVALVALVAFLLLNSNTASAQPPFPIIYEGNATIGGSPAPDGTRITARVGRAVSNPVEVKDGRYTLLVVDPSLEYDFIEDVEGLVIVFLADGVRAAETDVFREGTFLEFELDLHFPELPLTGDDGLNLLWPVMAGTGAASVAAGALLLAFRPANARRR